jgi:Fe-S cluster assembly protein SufD
VPAGVVVERPILVVHRSGGAGLASFPHTLLVAGENSEVTIADHFSSGEDPHLSSAVTELSVGDAARVRYVSLQVHGSRMWQIALQRATVGRDADLHAAAVALGGEYARLRSESLLTGRGANSDQLAVYYADRRQMLDFRTLQDHDAPHTTSNLLFKGAVEDEARSVYSGLVHLRPDAQRARATQSNRNLVLSEQAAAESIPNLVIEANDVQCSHASAVGPIDDDQLYYLESRGIPPSVAERLIVFGFFEDVINRLPVAGIAAPLRDAVTAKWGRSKVESQGAGRRG